MFVLYIAGIRRLKTKGSNKIDGICPAEISVKVFGDGTHEVAFINTHVGHTTDLEHLILSKSEKEMLASKIAAKIPFGTILDEVRDSKCDNKFEQTDNKLERTHMLTRKDLHNIKQCFNLNNESGSCTNKQSSSLLKEKHKIKNELCQIIDKISSSEEMEALKKLLAPVRKTPSAVKNFEGLHLENRVASTFPQNKIINQKRVSYKTKKATVRKDGELKLPIPDAQKSNDIAVPKSSV